MKVRKLIQERIRHSADGVNVAGDVNAAIAANVNEPGGSTHVSSKQTVVQRSGQEPIVESHVEGRQSDDR